MPDWLQTFFQKNFVQERRKGRKRERERDVGMKREIKV